MTLYLKALFLIVLFLHVALVKLTIVIPVRTIALFFFVGILIFVHYGRFSHVISRFSYVFVVIIIMAFLGAFLAVLNNQELYVVSEYFLRNALQPALVFISVAISIELFGLFFVVNAILFFAAASAGLAILQFVGIDLAWDLRRALGNIQGDPAYITGYLQRQSRPMGLLLTPIMFSYHLVSAYVIANLLFRHGHMQPRLYALFTLMALVGSVACGTRSLVLGILVHEGLQLAMRAQLKSYLWLSIVAALTLGGYLFLEAIGSRVVSVDDASAAVRMPLLQFGIQLFLYNPLGFGWGVTPGEYAWLFWEQISHLPKASGIYRLNIHNTFVNFLLQYGIFGFSIIALIAILNIRKTIAFLVTFLAYLINGMFHNAGVFVGDLYFWFAFAVFLYMYELRDLRPHASAQR